MDVIDVDGVGVRVRRQGNGRPIVYLHSIFGEVGALPFFDGLADAGFEVFAPELPGFGQSGALPGCQRLEDVVFHLRRLFDALGIEQTVLVGSSLGGWLAAEIGVWFPDRIEALVLIDALGIRVEDEVPFDIFGSSHHDLWAAAFGDGGDLIRFLGPVLAESEDGPDAIRLHLFRAMEATARIGWNPYLHDPKLPARLASLRAPTLIAWGGADRVVPAAHGDAFATAIPRARLEVLAGCGHVPALEQPRHAAAVIAGFVAPEVPVG